MPDETQTQPEQDEAPWPPHPELNVACPVCKAPPGFACVRKGSRWYVAKPLPKPHNERPRDLMAELERSLEAKLR